MREEGRKAKETAWEKAKRRRKESNNILIAVVAIVENYILGNRNVIMLLLGTLLAVILSRWVLLYMFWFKELKKI